MSRFDILIIGGGPAAITIGKVIGRKKRWGSSARKIIP